MRDADPPAPATATVAARLRAGYEGLTRAERRLAAALLDAYPMLGLGGITDLAAGAGVSTPTAARMVRKLGFAGFAEFQAALRAELEATLTGPLGKQDRWAVHAPHAHILNAFADAVSDNLRATLSQIEPRGFDAAAALLADPRRQVRLAGGRITRPLAEYLHTHLEVIRPGVALLGPGPASLAHGLLDLGPGDALVVFDIRRYARDLEHLAEMAAGRGAVVVLLTDQWGSPVGKHAAHVFNARTEAPSAWDSATVLLFLVEALIAAVQSADRDRTRERMTTLEAMFDRMRLFRRFG